MGTPNTVPSTREMLVEYAAPTAPIIGIRYKLSPKFASDM